jgi:thymidylate synthase (FAD)
MKIDLLDHGYVELIEARGDDRFIAQTARTSTATDKTEDEDHRLLRRLIRDEHTSPVEFASVVLQIKAPLFVARQWMRHRSGTFNEFSGRYSEFPEEFYVPELSRIQAQSTFNKQGSAEQLEGNLPEKIQAIIRGESGAAYRVYQGLLETGLTRELARMVLPTNYYTVYRWNVNLHNLFHFLRLREDAHAQYEIRVYAEAIHKILLHTFPVATQAFEEFIQDRVRISSCAAETLATLAKSSIPSEYLEANAELRDFVRKYASADNAIDI